MDVALSPQAIAATLLVGLGFYGLLQFFRKRTPHGEVVNWTPLEAVGITIAIYFVSQFAVALGIGAAASIGGLDQNQFAEKIDSSAFFQFIFVAGIEALTIGLLYVFMRRRKTPWKAIGWIKPKWRDLGYALGGFGVYFLTYGIIISSLVERYLPIDTEQRQELGFDTAAVGPDLILIFLSLVILPPLIEEIIVRGFLFTGLKAKLAFVPAALITSVVFGAAHLQWGGDAPLLWTAAIDTFILSMILVYLRHVTGSLWPGIVLHFIKNGLAFLALFVFKVV